MSLLLYNSFFNLFVHSFNQQDCLCEALCLMLEYRPQAHAIYI